MNGDSFELWKVIIANMFRICWVSKKLFIIEWLNIMKSTDSYVVISI